jgi:signal transduction histidine kinase
MPRLYFRFYAALLASLALLTVAVGLLWHYAGEPIELPERTLGTVLRNALPPENAPADQQQAALARLTRGLRADITLFSQNWERLAYVGEPLERPDRRAMRAERMARAERGEREARGDDAPLRLRRFQMRLEDGRHIVSSTPLRQQAPSRLRLHTMLIALALIIAIGAYPVVRRVTRRLEHLQKGVESLGAGNLSARVKVEGNDEVAGLAASFNRSADQIETLVNAHKSLLANASHELRTPLARIRLALELTKDNVEPKRRAGLEQDIAELDQLIDEILLASRLDSAGEQTENEEVDLLALAAEECSRYDEADLDGESLVVRGDARLLRRMLRNLLENARRHGVPPTTVKLRRSGAGDDLRAEIVVQDAGPGILAAEYDKVFEPFYRSSNARDSVGSGLGLALVRQIAQRHGGEARCANIHTGRSAFIITLPLAKG